MNVIHLCIKIAEVHVVKLLQAQRIKAVHGALKLTGGGCCPYILRGAIYCVYNTSTTAVVHGFLVWHIAHEINVVTECAAK